MNIQEQAACLNTKRDVLLDALATRQLNASLRPAGNGHCCLLVVEHSSHFTDHAYSERVRDGFYW